jgi:hypothetical protein
MHELVFIARRRFQERKERIWDGGFGRWFDGKKSDAGVKKKKTSPDRWGHGVSDARENAAARSHELARPAAGFAGFGPRQGNGGKGERAARSGERASWWAAGLKA